MIRRERPEDGPTLRGLLIRAFDGPAEADLVDRLRADGDAVIALVADRGGVCGHVLLSRMAAPLPALALAPLAVAPECQRQGIGAALVRAALEAAAEGGWRAVFVLGDPAYYGRFGFDPACAAGFDSPYAGPYLMALPLGGPLPVQGGPIRHAPAFAAI